MTLQEFYLWYCNAVAFVEIRKPNSDFGIGTAFHLGDGIFVTAKHVVHGNEIISIQTTTQGYHPDSSGDQILDGIKHKQYMPESGRVISGPFYHFDENVDVAVITVEGIDAPAISLHTSMNEYWADDEYILSEVLVLGYPPIPFSSDPRLVASLGHISTIIDRYDDKAPYIIVSGMPRGGFSGGPCIYEDGSCLGLVIESLVHDGNPAELGFTTVITAKQIFRCLAHNKLIPTAQLKNFEDFFVFFDKEKYSK